jgi:hypothetical protein
MVQTSPAPGVQLMRLAELRGLDVGSLASRAAVPEPEITSVLDGDDPDPSLLRQLAPALGLHPSDVFVIAGQQVPDDLAPLETTAANGIRRLAWSLTYLPRAVPELYQLVLSMPQQPRPQRPSAPTPPHHHYPSGVGGLLLRLLHNRNLDWAGSAMYLFGLGRHSMLSASTIGMIGHGKKLLTPDLLAGFTAFLDMSSRDLSALTGIDLTGTRPPAHPDAPEAAQLIWNARRLTATQLQQVHNRAHAIRHERAGELGAGLRCGCPQQP